MRSDPDTVVRTHAVEVETEGTLLDGDLRLPPDPRGLVLFAHGSGSSRHSPRNRFVARELNALGLGTLLMDLLTPDEEATDAQTGFLRFDVQLLARRLVDALAWIDRQPELGGLQVGLFGASTGAGAALRAAAERPEAMAAVVSRGGRPDLADEALPWVRAATLLIVGGEDAPVIELNQAALDQMAVEARLVIIPGATHLFEEPGALEEVARLAGDWFVRHLTVNHEGATIIADVEQAESPTGG